MEQINPARIELRDKRLQLMKEDMDQSADIRIKYAANYAQISNYWKYFIGQNEGIKRLQDHRRQAGRRGQVPGLGRCRTEAQSQLTGTYCPR